MDNIIKQLQHRPIDSTRRVPLKALYSDKNFVSLQDAIEDRNLYTDLPGLVTKPGLCVAGLTLVWDDFVCMAPGGVLCNIPSGQLGLSKSDVALARIDLITVDPQAKYDQDDEINYSGVISAVEGTNIFGDPQMPGCPQTRLKLAEVDIAAGATIVAVRDWSPNYVVPAALKPRAQDIPNLTVEVNPFRGFWVGLSYVDFAGASCTFTAPGDTSLHRVDTISLNSVGALNITAGAEVTAPTEPVAPDFPNDEIPVARVFLYGEQAFITQAEIIDCRPFASAVGVGSIAWSTLTGKPTAPSLEEMSVEHEADGVHTYRKMWTTLSFAYVGGLSTISNFVPALVAPCSLEIDKAYGYVKTAPVGGVVIVDFLIDDVSIFAAQADMIRIPGGSQVDESATPQTLTITKNQVITANIISVGITAAEGLTAHLRCLQTLVAGA